MPLLCTARYQRSSPAEARHGMLPPDYRFPRVWSRHSFSTIVRAIGKPKPVPCGLVVKNASKMVVKLSLGMPSSESLTVISAATNSTLRFVRIDRLRRSDFSIASIPFIAKLMITCCRCTGSARTGNASDARSTHRLIVRRAASGEIILRTSVTASFKSKACKSCVYRKPHMGISESRSKKSLVHE